MAVQSQSKVLNPTNDFLESLLGEFEGECRKALQLIEQLKKTDPDSEAHEDLEADLAVSLERFTWLAKDLLREWDKVIMSLPE
jgi:tellurite resistance protein